MKKKIGLMAIILLVEVVVAYFVLDTIMKKRQKELHPEDYPKEMTSYEFGELVVNPNGSKGRRYFIANIVVTYPLENEQFAIDIEKKKPTLTDTMMTIMMAKNVKELSTQKGREDLRDKLEKVIEEALDVKIGKLLFKKYLIQ